MRCPLQCVGFQAEAGIAWRAAAKGLPALAALELD